MRGSMDVVEGRIFKEKNHKKTTFNIYSSEKKNESVLPSRVAKATQNNLWISVQVIEGKM